MIRRLLRFKSFLGSTLEEIEDNTVRWLKDHKVCPGNLVDSKLYKFGSVYQLLLWYAVVEGTQ